MTAVTPSTKVSPNPLLSEWRTPFEAPPFDAIETGHFAAAFQRAFAEHTAEISAIASDPAEPDFENTIAALERVGKLPNKVSSVFYGLVSANSNPALLALESELAPRQARHWNAIVMNAKLYARIAAVWDKRATLGLNGEQMRLLERTRTRFRRAGAGLDEAAKARLSAINERLAELGTAFSHHLLADEQAWSLELQPDDLAGLPDAFVAGLRAAAAENGADGKAVISLSRSYVEPFLQRSSRRDLREKVWRAFVARGDNNNARRQQCRHCRDGAAARRICPAAGIRHLRRLQVGGLHGQDAGRGAQPPRGGSGPRRASGLWPIARRCRR